MTDKNLHDTTDATKWADELTQLLDLEDRMEDVNRAKRRNAFVLTCIDWSTPGNLTVTLVGTGPFDRDLTWFADMLDATEPLYIARGSDLK